MNFVIFSWATMSMYSHSDENLILLFVIRYLSSDSRGLEVRGHGPGPPVPLDLHRGGAGRHGWDHSPGG